MVKIVNTTVNINFIVITTEHYDLDLRFYMWPEQCVYPLPNRKSFWFVARQLDQTICITVSAPIDPIDHRRFIKLWGFFGGVVYWYFIFLPQKVDLPMCFSGQLSHCSDLDLSFYSWPEHSASPLFPIGSQFDWLLFILVWALIELSIHILL